jgi:hypothetical protein
VKLLSKNAISALTGRRLRTIASAASVALTLLVLLYGAARTSCVRDAGRATVLIRELSGVRLGQSEESVLPLIRRFGGFRSPYAPDSYSVEIDPLRFYRPFTKWTKLSCAIDWLISFHGNTRRTLGLRVWGVNGMLRISGGTVSSVSVVVSVEGENEWLMAEWLYSSEIPIEEVKLWNQGQSTSYLAHWTHLHLGLETGEGLISNITPNATQEELQAARSINLDCLTSFRGCHSLCELLPRAALYFRENQSKVWGWNSGSWGPQDHTCE